MKSTLYLRAKSGTVYQYEKQSEIEFIRYNPNFKTGHKWKNIETKYEILSTKGELKTPKNSYRNLLVLKSITPSYGTFKFYYKKGIGYVGATQNGKLISYLMDYTRE